jgi:hypothetical protein
MTVRPFVRYLASGWATDRNRGAGDPLFHLPSPSHMGA